MNAFKGRRFLTFSFIGGLVLLVDIAAFGLASSVLSNLVASRCTSLLVAMYASYVLNTRFTFRASGHRTSLKGFATFALSQAVGAAVNAAVSISLLSVLTDDMAKRWLPFAVGSAAGLLINFLLARRLLAKVPTR